MNTGGESVRGGPQKNRQTNQPFPCGVGLAFASGLMGSEVCHNLAHWRCRKTEQEMTADEEKALFELVGYLIKKAPNSKLDIENLAQGHDRTGQSGLANALAQLYEKLTGVAISARHPKA